MYTQCEKGHWFDPIRSESCPQCAMESGGGAPKAGASQFFGDASKELQDYGKTAPDSAFAPSGLPDVPPGPEDIFGDDDIGPTVPAVVQDFGSRPWLDRTPQEREANDKSGYEHSPAGRNPNDVGKTVPEADARSSIDRRTANREVWEANEKNSSGPSANERPESAPAIKENASFSPIDDFDDGQNFSDGGFEDIPVTAPAWLPDVISPRNDRSRNSRGQAIADPDNNGGAALPAVPLPPDDKQRYVNIAPVVGWLVCIDGPEQGKDYRIHPENNYVGSADNMDICIKGDRRISRERHIMIVYDSLDRAFYLGSPGGTNIVRLNGKPVLEAKELKPYDIITLGITKLMFIPFCGERFGWDE